MKKIAAFFDIDGTLVRESIQVKHFKKLVKYGIIDEKYWVNDIREKYVQFERRYGEFDDYLERVSEVYRENLEGIDLSLIDYTAKQVIEESGEIVYRYTRDRIKYHQENGHLVFFVSGSPEFLISKLSSKYKVTAYKGTEFVFDEKDKFTGKIIPMWDSVSKQKQINKFIEEYDIDVTKSYAYGDTNGDFSMLKTMGNPIAINPSHLLLEMIRDDEELRNRANIRVERKDVIYALDPSVTTIELD